jgi:hypothetical protein
LLRRDPTENVSHSKLLGFERTPSFLGRLPIEHFNRFAGDPGFGMHEPDPIPAGMLDGALEKLKYTFTPVPMYFSHVPSWLPPSLTIKSQVECKSWTLSQKMGLFISLNEGRIAVITLRSSLPYGRF